MRQWAVAAPGRSEIAATGDAFEQAYRAGVAEELPGAGADAARAVDTGARRGREAMAAGVAFGGCVLTPDERLEPGFVVVGADGLIAEVTGTRPGSVPVLDTGGVVLPGLIDLHGHPDFNVFSAWEPPQLFTNRNEWRGSDLYARLVRAPQNALIDALPPGTQNRYAEIRALVGGVTAIQGTSGAAVTDEESLVRNVDRRIFGRHRARALIDLPPEDGDVTALTRILAQVADGKVDAFYLHLGEGRPDDAVSTAEFDRMVELGALTPATVVIHGVAFDRGQLGTLGEAGARLVWSPQSNLRLYGLTTAAADALDVGLPTALGADWLPSGSPSLLTELKVARRVLGRQGRAVDHRELVGMVTTGAASIAGLGDELGALAAGRPADVLVLERRHDDPWVNVVEAEPAWVELVTIGGSITYGRADWVDGLAPGAADRLEEVVAWGKSMLLDTAYAAGRTAGPPPTLAELRAALIANYPPVGPIFA